MLDERVNGLGRRLERLVREALRVPRYGTETLLGSLLAQRACHADVVLVLLRAGELEAVEALIGRPITRCPPGLRARPLPYPEAAPRRGDERLVTRVREPGATTPAGRPQLLTTDLYRRLALVRVGLSVQQLLTRGVRRGDIRIAERRGLLELED